MAIPGYLYCLDEQGKVIRGALTAPDGQTGCSEVIEFHHGVYIPSDRDTGAVMSTRKHEPFIVKKAFGPDTPVLNQACSSGKTLQEVQLRWYHIDAAGLEKEYFRHTLHGVKVVAVRPMVADVKDRSKETYGHLEEVHFRYQAIQWLYLEGNIATQDSWLAIT